MRVVHSESQQSGAAPHRWLRQWLTPFVMAGLFCVSSLSGASAQTLLRDAEIEQYLRDYSNPLFEAAGLQPEAVEIFLVGDPSLNAFVTAGQKVFVHTGLITQADNPNQIQGVLAHETGHLAGGHQQRGAEAYASSSRPAMLSLVLGAAIIAAGGSADAGLAVTSLGQTVGIAEYLSYSQGQESSADQAAIGYLETVGASGQGLIEFFGKLKNRQLLSSRTADPYFSTHPLPLRRMSALRERVSHQSYKDVRDSETEMERLAMIQAKINGFMQGPQTTLRQYPLRDLSEPARYARAVAYYRASDLEKGVREIDRLIQADPDNPFFHELKGQMLFEHGKISESIGPHRRSSELAPQYALLKINLARALLALERKDSVDEATVLLKAALQVEPDNSFGWAELARAYAFVGDLGRARLSQAQAYFARGNLTAAHRFASGAREELESGTPEHLQALDIITASENTARRARQQRR